MQNADQITFFTTTAGIAGGAYALMFTALQVRPDIWLKDTLKKAAAMAALTELLIVAIGSLIIIAPGHHWKISAAAGAALGLGVSCYYLYAFANAYKATARTDREMFDRTQFGLTFFSIAVYSTLIIATLPGMAGIDLVAWIMVWLVFSGLAEVAALASWRHS